MISLPMLFFGGHLSQLGILCVGLVYEKTFVVLVSLKIWKTLVRLSCDICQPTVGHLSGLPEHIRQLTSVPAAPVGWC